MNYCTNCSKSKGFLPMKPRKEYQGNVFTFLCEGCGYILVDYQYNCLSDDCWEHHAEKKRYGIDDTSNGTDSAGSIKTPGKV